MKKSRLLGVVCAFCLSTSAQAVLLGSGQPLVNSAFVPSGTTSTTGDLSILYSPSGIPAASFLETLSSSSVGTTFIYNSGAQFDNAVSLLTNGHNDLVSAAPVSSALSFGDVESSIFSDDLSLNGIDFQGYNIESIHWVIDSYSINIDIVELASSIEIYGSAVVPIPAAAWLFGSGLLGLIGIARR